MYLSNKERNRPSTLYGVDISYANKNGSWRKLMGIRLVNSATALLFKWLLLLISLGTSSRKKF